MLNRSHININIKKSIENPSNQNHNQIKSHLLPFAVANTDEIISGSTDLSSSDAKLIIVLTLHP